VRTLLVLLGFGALVVVAVLSLGTLLWIFLAAILCCRRVHPDLRRRFGRPHGSELRRTRAGGRLRFSFELAFD